MSTTAEIDKSGRFVVPKRMRDALHLVPGTRLVIRLVGDSLIMEPEQKPRGLYMDNGTWVYDAGAQTPIDALEWLTSTRDERASDILQQPGE